MSHKIFIKNVINIDFALLSESSGPVGRSFNVDVFFEGHKTAEGMVIDFSLAKKITHSVLNQEFDHKLMVQQKQIRHQDHQNVICVSCQSEDLNKYFFGIHTHNHCIKVINQKCFEDLENMQFDILEKEMAKELVKHMPENISTVVIKLHENQEHDKDYSFYYTHNLCKHLGNCQKFHGHWSTVNIFSKNVLQESASKEQSLSLNGKYFICEKYIKHNETHSNEHLQLLREYTPELDFFKDHVYSLSFTGSQGLLSIIISKNLCLTIPKESTIENIAEYIFSLISEKDQEVVLYEGVAKGVVVS